jgi:outer membrane protein TolC
VDRQFLRQSGLKASAIGGRDRERRRAPLRLLLVLGLALLTGGCSIFDRASTAFLTVLPWKSDPDGKPASPSDDGVVQAGHYEAVASRIDYSQPAGKAAAPVPIGPARALRPPAEVDLRWLSLSEAIQMALANNAVVRLDADFLSTRNSLLVDPERAASIYDVAITRNGFQIGQRGEQAALSDFAPRLTTSMFWGRDENVQNNLFQSGGLQPGDTLYQETTNFNSRLEKIFDHGGSLALTANTDYSLNNAPARLFGSVYTGSVGAEYRQPLLQGFGTDYTSIAGPILRQSPSVLGVNQGVVIARINADISVTQFEAEVRNQIFDVTQVYWDLYQAYQQYDVQREITAGLKTIWDQVKTRLKLGLEGGGAADEAQAADNYYQSLATQRQSLADVYETEDRLRRLLGLPATDGTLVRPSDVPQTEKLEVDLPYQLGEALSNRVELRRQKMAVRSLQLQLRAARSLTQPRGDFVARYRVNAFGDRLLSSSDDDGVTPNGLRSAGSTLFQGDQTGWDLGFELSIPFGYLAERAQVNSLEWRLAKAMTALSAQELEIQHELRNAMIRLQRWHNDLQVAERRKDAALRRVAAYRKEFELGRKPADLLLRAQISSGEAQVALYRATAQYNKALANLSFRTGLILATHNVHIREGIPPRLYADAGMLLSADSPEPGVFDRVDRLVAPLLPKPASWEQKSEAALRQVLPAGYFPVPPQPAIEEPGPTAAVPKPLTSNPESAPVNAAPALRDSTVNGPELPRFQTPIEVPTTTTSNNGGMRN